MSSVKFRSNFLRDYIARTPLALAFERTLECKLLSKQQFQSPILDLGCGDGIFASILFADSIDTGIDPDNAELQKAGETGAYKELICCLGSEIPKPDASYQTVFSNSVLEHIPDLEPVLAEVYRILAPGGSFYFTVPADNFENWSLINQVLVGIGLSTQSEKYRRFFNRFWRHYHAYTDEKWQALASKAGFKIAECARYDAPRIALGNDILVPFALPSMLMKKFLRKWVLSTGLRRLLHLPFIPLFEAWVNAVEAPNGCLVFVKATKPLA